MSTPAITPGVAPQVIIDAMRRKRKPLVLLTTAPEATSNELARLQAAEINLAGQLQQERTINNELTAALAVAKEKIDKQDEYIRLLENDLETAEAAKPGKGKRQRLTQEQLEDLTKSKESTPEKLPVITTEAPPNTTTTAQEADESLPTSSPATTISPRP